MAKKDIKVGKTHQKKSTQIRRLWFDTEIKILLKLIEKHRASSKDLKGRNLKDVQKLRNQISLRDKARIIKLEYLM